MKTLPKSLGAIIREGDHFVVANGRKGNEVQYSPTADSSAKILGSFGASHGVVLYWDANETATRLSVSAGGNLLEYETLCAAEAEQWTNPKQRALRPLDAAFARLLAMAHNTEHDYHGSVKDLMELLGLQATNSYDRIRFLRELMNRHPGCATVEYPGGRGRGRSAVVTIWMSVLAGRIGEVAKF